MKYDGYCENCGIFTDGTRVHDGEHFTHNWECRECDTLLKIVRKVDENATEAQKIAILNKYSYPRYVWRDVARRYVRIYGGKLDIDTPPGDLVGTDHLIDKHGETIATVSYHSFYGTKNKIQDDYNLDKNPIPY